MRGIIGSPTSREAPRAQLLPIEFACRKSECLRNTANNNHVHFEAQNRATERNGTASASDKSNLGGVVQK